MIDVTDGSDVHVRLAALEFLLRHVPLTSHLADRLCPTAPIGNGRAHFKIWSGGRDLNPQPSPWKSETLPLSYPRPVLPQIFRTAADFCAVPLAARPRCNRKILEPGTGIEPVTSSLPRTRSTN